MKDQEIPNHAAFDDDRVTVDLTGDVDLTEAATAARLIIDIRDDPTAPFLPGNVLDGQPEQPMKIEALVGPVIVDQFESLLANTWQMSEALHQIGEFDPPTEKHVRQTALLAGHLANVAGRTPEESTLVIVAAAMHDLGKLDVPHHLVNPDDPTSAVIDRAGDDWKIMKIHPERGFIRAIELFRDEPDDSPLKKVVPLLILTHHCHNHAGTPYPSPNEMQKLADQGLLNLKDLEDPQLQDLAKIIAIADDYEAMTARRKYQARRNLEDPAQIEQNIQESHPDLPELADELKRLHLLRFPPNGWMQPIGSDETNQAELVSS